MTRRVTASARIRVEVEIGNSSTYGPDWTLEHCMEQVRKESLQKLSNLLQDAGGRIINADGAKVIVTIVEVDACAPR